MSRNISTAEQVLTIGNLHHNEKLILVTHIFVATEHLKEIVLLRTLESGNLEAGDIFPSSLAIINFDITRLVDFQLK